ncbi:MAG TPA: molecular chaperone HtpG [Woeseiaceae bacterium]|nr:molecular chaperone HtpG [Woeseiaceae bacterium]
MSKKGNRETLGFQAEVRQMLQLMIHSLYSNKEIFLRELISNASDAADKLRFEALATPDLLGDEPDLAIHVVLDADARSIAVVDNGIGMSRQELIDNLGTIARSGTAEFLQQMTGDSRKDARLIGQFGVGFYSTFIVADRVVVETRRAGLPNAEAVRWESDGQGEFTIEPVERCERGTRVTLHLKDSEKEFLDALRLETLIRKYSDHIAFPVYLDQLGEKVGEKDGANSPVNSATALWTRSRSEITDDEYKEFYKHLSHDFADPLVWSHNRVEGKREYTSLLYIPSRAPFDLWNREAPRGLKLYVQRVFIMDQAEQFLPLYLRFIKGVIDSSDLPLNVSRETLQQNAEIEAIRNALTRRVLDMLAKLAADGPEDYAGFWREFGQVLKEGIVEDKQNADKLVRLLRFSTTHSGSEKQDQSLADYLSRAGEDQDKIYYLLGDSHATASSSPHLEQLRQKGIEVLLLSDRIDPWIVDQLPAFEGKKLQDVGRGKLAMPDGDGSIVQQAGNEEHKPLLKKIKKVLKERVEAVNVSQRLVDSPACVIADEKDLTPQLRRMLEAAGQPLPEARPLLEINVEHPLVKRLSAEPDERRFEALSNVILDHALLAEGTPLANPAAYVRRMNELLLDMAGEKPEAGRS